MTMNEVDELCIYKTIKAGGILVPISKAQKAGSKLVKTLWKNNQHFAKEKLKDYTYGLVKATLDCSDYLVFICVTPREGKMVLRWTDKNNQTFLPKEIFMLCENEDGTDEIFSPFGFGSSDSKDDVPENAEVV